MINQLLDLSLELRSELDTLQFAEPVTHVYNPLHYAWQPYERYIRQFGQGEGRVVLLGMNPGPFGMMQVGVPFGEVAAVRDWMGIVEPVTTPAAEHPKRPILGFNCPRSEVSGRRLWAWAQEDFGSAEAFFKRFFVLNYCPLVWLQTSGKNHTPEMLPAHELAPVLTACNEHLKAVLSVLKPSFAVGIGGFAEERLRSVAQHGLHVGKILHPSPASPAANRGWATQARQQMRAMGIIS